MAGAEQPRNLKGPRCEMRWQHSPIGEQHAPVGGREPTRQPLPSLSEWGGRGGGKDRKEARPRHAAGSKAQATPHPDCPPPPALPIAAFPAPLLTRCIVAKHAGSHRLLLGAHARNQRSSEPNTREKAPPRMRPARLRPRSPAPAHARPVAEPFPARLPLPFFPPFPFSPFPRLPGRTEAFLTGSGADLFPATGGGPPSPP